MIRVLPQYHDPCALQRGVRKGVEYLGARREHLYTGSLFRLQESAESANVGLFKLRGQMPEPARFKLYTRGHDSVTGRHQYHLLWRGGDG